MKLIKKHIIKIILLILLIVIIICAKIKVNLNENKEVEINNDLSDLELVTEEEENNEEEEVVLISVDIKGAIKNPGVYQLESNKKVIDVVNLAGGLTDDADTSLVNLAKNVVDEMVVIIYTKEQVEEAKNSDSLSIEYSDTCVCPEISNDACLNSNSSNSNNNSTSSSSSSSSSKDSSSTSSTTTNIVNINTATLEELQTLSGIGESKAQAIIDYRTENGAFNSIEDILNVSGIGEALYEKIKDYITV